jgi:hypothetical protein
MSLLYGSEIRTTRQKEGTIQASQLKFFASNKRVSSDHRGNGWNSRRPQNVFL